MQQATEKTTKKSACQGMESVANSMCLCCFITRIGFESSRSGSITKSWRITCSMWWSACFEADRRCYIVSHDACPTGLGSTCVFLGAYPSISMIYNWSGNTSDSDMVTMFEDAFKQEPTNEELGAQTFFANVRTGNWKAAQQVRWFNLQVEVEDLGVFEATVWWSSAFGLFGW